MDPLLLNSQLATPKTGTTFIEKLSKYNWINIIFHIIPIMACLLIAFQFKDRYDKKRALYDEFLVLDEIPEGLDDD
jgi:hypothetical protein